MAVPALPVERAMIEPEFTSVSSDAVAERSTATALARVSVEITAWIIPSLVSRGTSVLAPSLSAQASASYAVAVMLPLL